jgi:hypothetical protein
MVEPRLKVGPGCYPRVYLCMAGPGRPLGTDAERRSPPRAAAVQRADMLKPGPEPLPHAGQPVCIKRRLSDQLDRDLLGVACEIAIAAIKLRGRFGSVLLYGSEPSGRNVPRQIAAGSCRITFIRRR